MEEVIIYRRRQPFNSHHCPEIDTYVTVPTLDLPLGLPLRKYELLQLWTLSINLKISHVEASPHGREVAERGTLVDRNNVFCGSVAIDDFYLCETGGTYEFLVLSECRYGVGGSAITDRNEWDREMIQNPERWDLFWVMLIERDEHGIVERRGLGQIYQRAISTAVAGPEWKEIVLG